MSQLLKHHAVRQQQPSAHRMKGPEAPPQPSPAIAGPSVQEQALRAAKEEAVRAGHAEGLAAGKAEGLKQMELELKRRSEALEQEFARATEQQLTQLLAKHEQLETSVQACLADYVLAACARLLGQAWATPAAAQAAVQHVIEDAGLAEPFVLRVSPHHLASLAAAFPQLHIEVGDDVRAGGVRIEANPVSVDARLETQLQLIEKILRTTPPQLEQSQGDQDHG